MDIGFWTLDITIDIHLDMETDINVDVDAGVGVDVDVDVDACVDAGHPIQSQPRMASRHEVLAADGCFQSVDAPANRS